MAASTARPPAPSPELITYGEYRILDVSALSFACIATNAPIEEAVIRP
jgi:hypothetical protein